MIKTLPDKKLKQKTLSRTNRQMVRLRYTLKLKSLADARRGRGQSLSGHGPHHGFREEPALPLVQMQN